jgi:hypothetical protein
MVQAVELKGSSLVINKIIYVSSHKNNPLVVRKCADEVHVTIYLLAPLSFL